MKIATTKQRILQYIDFKHISKQTFFKETGLKRGFLDADKLETSIPDTFIATIIATYPEINLAWLLTGQGEMLSTHQVPSGPKDSLTDENRMLLQEKDARIAALEKIISSQDRTIELLEEKIAVLSAPPVVPVVDTAAAG